MSKIIEGLGILLMFIGSGVITTGGSFIASAILLFGGWFVYGASEFTNERGSEE